MWPENSLSIRPYQSSTQQNTNTTLRPNITRSNFHDLTIPRMHIITGPPGAGKTSLIQGLEIYHEFGVIREAATDIISLELAQGISAPWTDPAFDAKILALQIQRCAQISHSSTKPVLCDRSPIDIYAYAEFHNTLLPMGIEKYSQEMILNPALSKTVLFIENLGHIQNSAIRPETLQDACEIERLLYKYYTLFGFKVVRIPALPLLERIDQALVALNCALQQELASHTI